MDASKTAQSPGRLTSIDAYRGLVMVAMASGGLAFGQISKLHPDNAFWRALAFHTEHVEWVGCSFWDLIQPSFMFLVGVAMPFSYAQREARGDSRGRQFRHALIRSAVLVLLGVFLASAWSKQTNWAFTNVLAQIGLGYPLVFLLLGRPVWVQCLGVVAILLGDWALFALYPLPSTGFDFKDWGASPDLNGLGGFLGHWAKNANAATAFDRWFLNLFPRPAGDPFRFSDGGYATLNFVPSAATMLIGVLAGELLRKGQGLGQRLRTLLVASAACFALGLLCDQTVCPIVKRIWTPSWVLFSSGWTLLMLAAFHGAIDVAGCRGWAFPLVVVGANSIAFYMMAQLMKGFVAGQLQTHFGQDIFQSDYGATVRAASVLLVFWLIAFWMYRQRIHVRI